MDDIDRLMDNGRFIEAGWVSFKQAMFPNAPDDVSFRLRVVFYGGAQNLFTSIVIRAFSNLDEPLSQRARDELAVVQQELDDFQKSLRDFAGGMPPAQGSA